MERAFERLETLNAVIEPKTATTSTLPASVLATLPDVASERVMSILARDGLAP
jgi:hypothetical protein